MLVSVGLGEWVNIAELMNKFYPSTRAIFHWATDKWLGKEGAKQLQNGSPYGLIKILLKSYFGDHSQETQISLNPLSIQKGLSTHLLPRPRCQQIF